MHYHWASHKDADLYIASDPYIARTLKQKLYTFVRVVTHRFQKVKCLHLLLMSQIGQNIVKNFQPKIFVNLCGLSL